MNDANPATRRNAAIALLNLAAATSALPVLRAAVEDPDPTVRCYALKAIKAIEGNPVEAR